MRPSHAQCCIHGFACALMLCSAAPASAQSNPDPCGLLTQAEVSAATGASVGAGHALGETCNWNGSPRIIVSLWYPGPTMWQAIEHPNAAVKQMPAPGVGDLAFYNTAGGFTTFGVKKGTTGFVVKVYGIPEQSKQMAIEKTLAQTLLAKM
jgi:hypothetical protein